MKLPVLLKRVFLAVLIAALVISLLIFNDSMQKCEISFSTTLLAYFYLCLIIYLLGRLRLFNKEVQLVMFSICLALLIGEIALYTRGGFPLSYPEISGGNYTSEYCGQMFLNEEFLLNRKGKKDIYTKEFEPYEKRDIANVEGLVKPYEIYNRLGFRGKLPAKNKKVVMCLGDSFTEGACVTMQHSYPYLLGQYAAAVDSNRAVMNAGTSGNDPFYEFKTLQKLTDSFNVGTAIFLLNPSDIEDVVCRGGNERFYPDGTLHFRPTPWWERLYGLSMIFRLVTHNVFKLDYHFYTKANYELLRQQSILEMREHFKNVIIPFCKEKNITLIVAIHPFESDLKDNRSYIDFTSAINELQLPETIDLFDTVKKASIHTNLYYKMDGHFNEKGYEVVARAIFAELLKTSHLQQ